MDENAFNWLSFLSVPEEINHVAMVMIIGAGLIVLTLVARLQLARAMSKPDGALVPEPKWSYRNFFEIVAENLYKFTESMIGEHAAPTYFPLIGTLFVFIFTSNVLGLIPGFLPATDNFNTTLALGVFVFVFYNFEGLRANGLAHFKHFLGPVMWLAPLMVVIELVSDLARPFSLGMRLRGNILGDHIVLSVFSHMVPYLIPIIFYGLGVFVSFMQAFVFCLLTMVYISLAVSHDDH